MVNTVTITKRLTNTGWAVTGRIDTGATIPTDIFVYTNTGTAELGEFHSTVMVQDLSRIPVWAGVAVPTSYQWVRTSTIKILLDTMHNVDDEISKLKASLQKFVIEFNSEKESTKTYVLD